MKRSLALALAVVLLFGGVATWRWWHIEDTIPSLGFSFTKPIVWAEFASMTPPHYDDWARLVAEMDDRGIRHIRAPLSLGSCEIEIDTREFQRARKIACRLIEKYSLTVRLAKDGRSGTWEVWKLGVKTNEENYNVAPPELGEH